MNNIPMPELSPNFTIEDIHKIREWYEKTYDGMTPQEISAHTHREAECFRAELAKPADPAIEAEVQRRLASVRKPAKASI